MRKNATRIAKYAKRGAFFSGFFRPVALLLALLSFLLLLSACASKPTALTYSNGAFRNEKKGAAFIAAPFCYRAAAILTDSPVAVITGFRKDDIPLYAVKDMDPSLWLADTDYALYYGGSGELPTLSGLSVTRITLCRTGSYAFAVGVLEDPSAIEDLVDIYSRAATIPVESVDANASGISYTRFELLFSSSLYPGINYVLEYRKYDRDVNVCIPLAQGDDPTAIFPGLTPSVEEIDGKRMAVFALGSGLLYDRSTGECFAIGELLEGYFNE